MEQTDSDAIIWLEEVDSTNSYLKNLLLDAHLPEGMVVAADYQSRGRGQMGNSWFSSKGLNLLFSLLIYPDFISVKEQFVISEMFALAVKHTLDSFADGISIKWPNDIYHNDRKIAGILIENNIQGDRIKNTVIGAGINLNEEAFPETLPNPVSLRQITGKEYDRKEVLRLLLDEFFTRYEVSKKGDFRPIYNEYMQGLYRAEGYHRFEDANGIFLGRISCVMPSGHLVLRLPDSEEERMYAFKEVKFLDE